MGSRSPLNQRPAILVTGGARRIGRAVALAFADDGYDVALHYRSSVRDARRTARDIENKGVRCRLLQARLDDERAGALLARRARQAFPGLSVLVHTASCFKPSGLGEKDAPLLKVHMGVHVGASWGLGAAFATGNGQGVIIHFLDTRITRDRTGFGAYLLSKKSLAALVTMSAAAFAPRVRVNAVAPGFILPPEGKGASYLKARARAVPLGRQGNIAEVVDTVRFLVRNTYVTGQTIFVDGGEHLI